MSFTLATKVGTLRSYALLSLFLLLTLVVAACGEENGATATPTGKQDNLPLNRALILSNRDGWPDLYTVDLSGKITGRLTENQAAEYGATWSPDGRKVAYTELNGDQASGDYGRERRIVVIDADGKNRRVVSQDGFNPVWAPDSQRLLFTRVSQARPSGQSAPVERGVSNIAAAPEVTATPNFSKPGATTPETTNVLSGTPRNFAPPVIRTEGATPVDIAGKSDRTSQVGLYLVSIESSQPALLVQDAVSGVWAPNGKRIAYIGGNNSLDQKRSLNLVNPDGSGRISLTERARLNDLDVLYVAWAPDNSALAFTATDLQANQTSLYRLSPEGSAARRLTDYNGSAREIMSLIWAYADYYNPATKLHLGPVWSPNSRSLAFTDGSARLTVVDASSGNARYFPVGSAALGQDKDSVLNVTWLADSRRLLYDRAAAGRNSLLTQAGNYIYDFFDETLESLDTVNKNTLVLSNSSGGTLLPVCCGMDLLGAGDPEATPAKTATTQAVATGQALDEGKLVYVSGIGQRKLVVSDLKTAQQTVITSGPFKQVDFNLSPKGGQMVYVEVGDRFSSVLYLTSLDGKQKTKLSEGGGNPDDLSYVASWSPDGKHLAFQALNNDPNLKPGLYTVTLDENGKPQGSPRLLTTQDVAAFVWSPDNRYVAFKIDAMQYELWVAPIDGSSAEQRLAAVGRFDNRYSSLGRGLAWSPDGKFLAMSGAGNMSLGDLWQIWLISPQGRVIEEPSYYINRLIGFSPDSSRLIATVASTGQSSSIQAYNLPGGPTQGRGWRSYDRGYGPQISPDSQSLAFYNWANDSRSNGQPVSMNPWYRVMLINFANGVSRPINLNYAPYYAFKARFYTWDPTGKKVAFYENNTIYLASTQGTQQNQQTLARAFVVDRLAWTK